MKITCPHCQATYKVNLPTLGDAGMDVKCARCQETFKVHKEEPSPVGVSGEGSNSGYEDPGSSIEDQSPSSSDAETPPMDDDLDALLDDLIEREISQPDSGAGDTKTPAAEAKTSVPEKEDTSEDETVDEFLDDLLNEPDSAFDTPPKEVAEQIKTEAEETAVDNQALDEIWEDAVQEGAQEEQASIAETLKEETTPEQAAPAPTESEEEPDADMWAQAFADQAAVEAGQADETAETAPEAAGGEGQSEEEQSEEDLWAQAFADQAAVEAGQTDETAEPAPEAAGGEGQSEEEQSEEDLWAQAFADQAAVEAGQTDETAESAPEAAGGEGQSEEEQSEEDLWAQAFADQAEVEAGQTDEAAEAASETADSGEQSEEKQSEEDLWAQAFGELDQETEGDADTGEQTLEADEESTAEDEEEMDEELAGLASMQQDEGGGLGLADEALEGYNEADYADDEDDYDYETPKKGFSLSLPQGKTGKFILGGSVLALALIAGSAYFAFQTFAPEELTKEGTVAQKMPEPDAADAPAAEAESPQGEEPAEPAQAEPDKTEGKAAADNKGPSAVETAQAKLLEDDKATSGETPKENLGDALTPFAAIIEMSTIMPVAYSPNDIKVLSFTLELEMENAKLAESMRSTLPIYEKVMVSTVENFLRRSFYNDILYVKEKLVKRLELAINKELKNGKVKRAKFKDFQIS